jgi:hypothetical protein
VLLYDTCMAARPRRDTIEAKIWKVSGWRGSLSAIAEIMDEIDALAAELARDPAPPGAVARDQECSSCGEPYPLTPEYFHRDRSKPTGFRARCRACISQEARAYRENRRKVRAA